MPERELTERTAPPRRVPGAAASRAAHPILALQRTAGNEAVQRFLAASSERTKLETHLTGNAARIVAACRAALAAGWEMETVGDDMFWTEFGGTGTGKDKAVTANLKSIVASGSIPIVAGQPAPDGLLRLVVERLNAMEEFTKTHHVRQADPATIMYGTEFTFTNDGLRRLQPLMEKEKKGDKGYDDRQKVRDQATGAIATWEAHVRGRKPAGVPQPAVAAVDGKAGPGGARRFTYTGPDWSWDWTLDIDDACLETQTRKSTAGGLGGAAVRAILKEHVFGGAAAAGVTVDVSKNGGSGHISLDAGTTFGGSVTAFLDFLEVLQTAAAEWKAAMHPNVASGFDGLNSPWLADQEFDGRPALDAFRAEVGRIRAEAVAGKLDITGAAARLNAFYKDKKLVNKHVDFTKARPEQKANVGKSPEHYQAVNVEHVKGEDDGSQRVELRDVPAQTDVDRLERDLATIAGYVTQARRRR